MKINLEFESDDLENMLTEYFEKSGFVVQNLAEICAAFEQVFPQGLIVRAEMAPLPPTPSVPTGALAEPVVHTATIVEPVETPAAEEPRLSHADLLDPTHRKHRTAEDDVQDEAEIRNIRRISDQLAARRGV